MRREHESLLVEWVRAARALQRSVVTIEGLQLTAGFGLAAWLLFERLGRGGEPGAVLLLAYWALNLPVLGQELAQAAWQYPLHRNLTLRLIEPLGALEETPSIAESKRSTPRPDRGAAIEFENVSVNAGGHRILDAVRLSIESGAQVAVVGASGAGKSSLVGLLLGWHRPASGRVLVDGVPLDGEALERLRRETAWVDPSVHLWNRSLLENLRYGATSDETPTAIGAAVDAADLREVLQRLPDGLQTSLGEGGGLVSGGEGQRVRLGRALQRDTPRLVVLDEPFRGLERERRRALLDRSRRCWRTATLLCITHDVSETLSFDRVIVVDQGRIVEDGRPAALAARPDSRYRAMLDAEGMIREGLWNGDGWRALRLERGAVSERRSEQST
jgi:ATP-binding cassette subfamily B protein